MPRSKPDNITIHRIELGGWERERVKQAELVAAGAVLLPALGIAAVGLAAAGSAYAVYNYLKDGPFVPLTDAGKELKNKLVTAEAEYRAATPDWLEKGIDEGIANDPMLRYGRWWWRLVF